jgi:hypothetical protein
MGSPRKLRYWTNGRHTKIFRWWVVRGPGTQSVYQSRSSCAAERFFSRRNTSVRDYLRCMEFELVFCMCGLSRRGFTNVFFYQVNFPRTVKNGMEGSRKGVKLGFSVQMAYCRRIVTEIVCQIVNYMFRSIRDPYPFTNINDQLMNLC